MNILSCSTVNECTSCQMCAAICSHDAITINLNLDGFYRPNIDENKCVDCGLCTKVCYKFDEKIDLTSPERIRNIGVYSAQSKSDDLLKDVTSGGVADSLAKVLVQQGFVCIGVTYNIERHRAEHIAVFTEDGTKSFRGSKYIQSYSIDAFKELVKNVRTTKFAVFGLPCHIYAINKYLTLRKIRDKCILIDLFCHGCPSMHVWTKYREVIRKKIGNKKIDKVNFRSKAKGWGAFNISVLSDKTQLFVSTPMNDEFYSLFFSDLVLNDACSNCALRSTVEYTDVRLGDFWGKRFVRDRKGVSAVAISSERGNSIFKAIKNNFRTEQHSMEEVIKKQSYGIIYHTNMSMRKIMMEALRDESKSLTEITKFYYSKQGILPKLKRVIKLIDWYLPFDITRFFKRFA